MMVKAAEERYQDRQNRWRDGSPLETLARGKATNKECKFPGQQWTMNN